MMKQSYKLMESYPELLIFSTTRDGGVSLGNYASMNVCDYCGDNAAHVKKNREIVCEQYGIALDKLILPRQTHGAKVVEIDEHYFTMSEHEQNVLLQGVDAMVTSMSEVCLGIQTADCVPVLFYDPKQHAVGVAHCGWRGTVARLAALTALEMHDRFGCAFHDIRVIVGPSISVGSYEVGEELIEAFEEAEFPIGLLFKRNPKTLRHYLDLWSGVIWQLKQIGIPEEHIEQSGVCTFKNSEQWFSARVLGIRSGRILSGIMMKRV